MWEVNAIPSLKVPDGTSTLLKTLWQVTGLLYISELKSYKDSSLAANSTTHVRFWMICQSGVSLSSSKVGGRYMNMITTFPLKKIDINPLNPELNPICYLLALLGAHHFLRVSRIRVKSLTFRLLMSYIYIYTYIYGAPILVVSRSHTTTQHSR